MDSTELSAIGRRIFDHALYHYDEDHSALIPSAEPVNAPALDFIARLDLPEEPQELRFNMHSPCMALPHREVNAS